MTCAIESDRPCGSSSRAKNRYTRKEIEALATGCGLKDTKKKNMDELCKEVTKKSRQNAAASGAAAAGGKNCSAKSPVAFKPNYECNRATGRWKRKPGSLSYHYRYELIKLSNVELNKVAMNLGVNTPTLTRDALIEEILEKQYPIVEDRDVANNIYVRKFKDIVKALSERKNGLKEVSETMRFYDSTITNLSEGLVVSNILDKKDPISFVPKFTSIRGTRDIGLFKRSVASDITGIQLNESWFTQQKTYQMALPFIEQLMILTYTHGGDKMIHLHMDDIFDPLESYDDSYYFEYVFPLYPAFLLLMVEDPKHFRELFLDNINTQEGGATWGETEKGAMDVLRKCGWRPKMAAKTQLAKGSALMKKYAYTMKNVLNGNQMALPFYQAILRRYIKALDKIIVHSPPLQHNIVVYKGSTQIGYFDFSRHNIYKNKRYMSVTMDLETATSDVFTSPNCCIQKILLLRGTKVLYPIISYYHEYELILPRHRHLYATSPVYKPSNNKKEAINLVVTN
jgi:hypothetical protein